MSSFYWGLVASMFALLVGVPLGIGLLMVLVPGRKGSMRGERELTLRDTDLESARAQMIARLKEDRFVIDPPDDALLLRATRQGADFGEVHTHADKTMKAEIRLRASGADAQVTVAAWLQDFIIYDTGESRVVDVQLERLVHGVTAREPEIVPNLSFTALTTLVASGVSIPLLIGLATMPANPMRIGVLAGVALCSVTDVIVALRAKAIIRGRPAELSGGWMASLAIVLAIIGLVGAAGIAAGPYGPLIKQMILDDLNRGRATP